MYGALTVLQGHSHGHSHGHDHGHGHSHSHSHSHVRIPSSLRPNVSDYCTGS